MSTSILCSFINGIKYLYEWIKIFLPEKVHRKLTKLTHIYYRDIRFLFKAKEALNQAKMYQTEKSNLKLEIRKLAKSQPEKPCFLHDGRVFTFQQVEDYSNKIYIGVGASLSEGDVVALLLPNCIEFSCIWLGLSTKGVISALINTNLRLKQLLHCINSVKPKAIIFSNQYDTVLADILKDLDGEPKLFSFEGNSSIRSAISFPRTIDVENNTDVNPYKMKGSDIVIYIYTSGTTGLPKPAKITLSKLFGTILAAKYSVGIKEDDIIYSPMPMYHLASVSAVLMCFGLGATLAIRNKFSASYYISDCQKYGATIGQYIGEMLRYILQNTQVKPNETRHNIRALVGNGVRADVWKKMVKRFQIPQIIEYYGSTEGNFILANSYNQVGCCGYLPIGIPRYYNFGPSVIKVTEEGEPIRNKNGLCTLVNPDEPGVLIGLCPAGNDLRKFHGYLSKEETESKIIRNVFKHGDWAFNTGDLVVLDDRGWMTFVDRLGDTYRWKGENVSTTEVEEILNSSSNIIDSAVYGVKVGSYEGKAGMASIIMKQLNLEDLQRHIDVNLPAYAQPLFIRLVDSLQLTSTFKIIKLQLKKQNFDITRITDPLFIKLNGKYVPITNDIYQQIQNGSIKL